MIVLFISVAGIVIKCIDGNWCESVNPRILTDMIALGGVEILFEMGEFLRIYVGKDKIQDESKRQNRDRYNNSTGR